VRLPIPIALHFILVQISGTILISRFFFLHNSGGTNPMNAVQPGTDMGRTQIYPLLFTTLCTVALTFCSCTDEPSGPTPPVTPDTTSHEFVWEVDTLFFRGTTQPVYFQAKAFYGTSASNVYMVGYSNVGYECWRWNGAKWAFFDLGRYALGDIADIDGIDSSFIVFLGRGPAHATIEDLTSITVLDNGVIRPIPKPLGTRNRTCLHVVSRNEIYLGGVDGIQRYDGTKWEWILDTTDSDGFELRPMYIQKFSDGTLECVIERFASGESTKYYRGNLSGASLSALDSLTLGEPVETVTFGHSIATIGSQIWSTGHGGTFVRSGSQWEKKFSEGGAFVSGYPNNVFIGQGWSYLWHYNGSAMANLRQELDTFVTPASSIYSGIFLQGNVFLFMDISETREPVVIHGHQQQIQ
jgi:hypothetical protein